VRPRFVQGIGGTLEFKPSEAGVPSSALVTIKRSTGADLPTPVIAAAAAIAADGKLSYVLSGAQCPDPAGSGSYLPSYLVSEERPLYSALYRAAWRYVIGAATYESDQLYEVRRRILKPTLTIAELIRRLPASLEELTGDGTTTSAVEAMGDAWDDVLDDLAEKGYQPDRVMDVDRLRRPHRTKTLANFAKSWGPAWKEWAAEREKEYREDLAAALTAGDWYDKNDSLTQSPGEVKTLTISCTR